VNLDLTDFRVCIVSSLVSALVRVVVVFRRTNGPRVEDMLMDRAGNRANGSSSSESLVARRDNPSIFSFVEMLPS
jgi:hypothetical protein